jgi:hypothetical protein
MTLFDILVPVIALLLAGVGVLIVHLTDKKPSNRPRTR